MKNYNDGNFVIFSNYKEYFEKLTPDQCKKLMLSLFKFAETEEIDDYEDIVLNIVLKTITDNIIFGSKRRMASIQNGYKGGRPKKNEFKIKNEANKNHKNDLTFMNEIFLKFNKKIDCNNKTHFKYCNKIFNYLKKGEINEKGLIKFMLYKFQQYDEWGEDKVKLYFKPATLFNDKFLAEYETAQMTELSKDKYTYENGKFITKEIKQKIEDEEWINE